MTSVIVDASIAVKWFFQEADTPAALALCDGDSTFVAPELILAEIGNAAWKKRVRNEIDNKQALFVVRRAPALFSSLVTVAELVEAAMELSVTLPHPIYDCFYLALAQRENAAIVTADERLFAAARKARIKARRL